MTDSAANLKRSADALRWRTRMILRNYVVGRRTDDWLRAKERAAVDRACAVRRLRVTAFLCVVAVVVLAMARLERWMP